MRAAHGGWIVESMIAAPHRRTSPAPRRAPRAPARTPPSPAPSAAPRARLPASVELEQLACRWQRSLDATDRALTAARFSLEGPELATRRRALGAERQESALALAQLARAMDVRPAPWLSQLPVTPALLGLAGDVEACVFDLEGVLTDSAVLHAWAWGEVFDDLRSRLAERTGWHFVPFDRHTDYRAYVDGRSRREGVHAFLESRGIRLPDGRSDDPASAVTVCGLARRKGELLARRLGQQGVTSVAGARRYLEAAGRAGLGRAVVSASASALPMLERSGLSDLIDARIDADVIRVEGLRSRPAPDVLLVACSRLGVAPEAAVTFTHSAAGVAAGRAAGLTVVGVATGAEAEALEGFGAEQVVAGVSALLPPRLAAAEPT
jgi:HAD superfamily hydrolase (TIGR01509 family)